MAFRKQQTFTFFENAFRMRKAMRMGRPLEDSSIYEEPRPTREFEALATSIHRSDFRVTTIHCSNGLRHEYYVRSGQIYHVQFLSSPPWTHASQFIVGTRVRRIAAPEKHAILKAVQAGGSA
jgi:hypothetical protein